MKSKTAIKAGITPINYKLPQFSWEKPIEEEILNFTRNMAIQMERASDYHKETGWFANNELSENCARMAQAYRTVEEYILKEIKIRKSIKTTIEVDAPTQQIGQQA